MTEGKESDWSKYEGIVSLPYPIEVNLTKDVSGETKQTHTNVTCDYSVRYPITVILSPI